MLLRWGNNPCPRIGCALTHIKNLVERVLTRQLLELAAQEALFPSLAAEPFGPEYPHGVHHDAGSEGLAVNHEVGETDGALSIVMSGLGRRYGPVVARTVE